MRTNYVLIDFENVQPESLEQLEHDHFKLFVFVGANQTKLPFEIAASVHRLGTRADYIKISGNGSNALDFHIAFYIGQLAVADPSAYFHIVSKDNGFDPLIDHLKSKGILAGRVTMVADISAVKTANAKSPTERLQVVLARLQQLKTSKPRTVKTLSGTIAALFQKQLSEAEVAVVIQGLASQGYLTVTDNKVAYSLPNDN